MADEDFFELEGFGGGRASGGVWGIIANGDSEFAWLGIAKIF